MLEEAIDPNPDPAPFSRLLALAAQTLDPRTVESWSQMLARPRRLLDRPAHAGALAATL